MTRSVGTTAAIESGTPQRRRKTRERVESVDGGREKPYSLVIGARMTRSPKHPQGCPLVTPVLKMGRSKGEANNAH